MSQKYLLFVRREKPVPRREGSPFSTLFWEHMESECWKKSDIEFPDGRPTFLQFVCEVENPKQVAEHVRKAPLEKYVLFKGEVVELQVAIPVFANGKSLDTLSKEWES